MNDLILGLDIVNYRGKWKDAKRLASYRYGSYRGGEYWLLVRTYFLAMGGDYIQ